MIYLSLEAIFSVFFIYYHNYFFMFIVIGFMIISYSRNRKNIFILSQFLLFVFLLFNFNHFNLTSQNEDIAYYKVIESNNEYAILESNNTKYIYYHDDLKVGNEVLLLPNIEVLNDNKSEFNKYLKTQNIHYLIKGDIVCKNEFTTFSYKIIEWLLKDKDEYNKNIIKLILFNIKDDSNNDFYRYFEKFSIGFLLVISGFHINLLFKVLKRSKFFKYPFILFYLFLLEFSVSSYKAFLYFCLKKICKKSELAFNNCDILSLIMMAFLFVNPSYCFNKGFIYSFSFSFIIDILNNSIYKKGIATSIIKKIVIYLVSVPIVLFNYYEITTGSFLAIFLFTYPVSFLFVFSFVYLFLDKFYIVYKLYIYLLRLLLDFISSFSIDLIFGKPSYIIMILLFLCLMMFVYLYQNKMHKRAWSYIGLYLILCVYQYNIPNLSTSEIVYFIDVGQGDCSALKIKNSKSVVLIDTGGSKNYDVSNNKIIPFLKKQGINRIEKIIISHDDYDHNGAKDSLIENFSVVEIVEDSSIREIYIGGKKFINLNMSDNNDNDSSMVLYGEYGGVKYLFTGDISSKVEKKIIDTYENLSVDVLKVSHHGSKDSSCLEFLKSIKGKVALIGVGRGNLYKHPHKETLERLSELNYLIYRSDLDGNIKIYKSIFSEDFIIEKE